MTYIEAAIGLLNKELENLGDSLSDGDRKRLERIVKELRDFEDNL